MPALRSVPGTSAMTLPDWRKLHRHGFAALQDALQLLGIGER
jgi:hypothetical protein